MLATAVHQNAYTRLGQGLDRQQIPGQLATLARVSWPVQINLDCRCGYPLLYGTGKAGQLLCGFFLVTQQHQKSTQLHILDFSIKQHAHGGICLVTIQLAGAFFSLAQDADILRKRMFTCSHGQSYKQQIKNSWRVSAGRPAEWRPLPAGQQRVYSDRGYCPFFRRAAGVHSAPAPDWPAPDRIPDKSDVPDVGFPSAQQSAQCPLHALKAWLLARSSHPGFSGKNHHPAQYAGHQSQESSPCNHSRMAAAKLYQLRIVNACLCSWRRQVSGQSVLAQYMHAYLPGPMLLPALYGIATEHHGVAGSKQVSQLAGCVAAIQQVKGCHVQSTRVCV